MNRLIWWLAAGAAVALVARKRGGAAPGAGRRPSSADAAPMKGAASEAALSDYDAPGAWATREPGVAPLVYVGARGGGASRLAHELVGAGFDVYVSAAIGEASGDHAIAWVFPGEPGPGGMVLIGTGSRDFPG